MIHVFEGIVAIALFLWSIAHWIYLGIHLLCGPFAVFIAADKGYVVGLRGIVLACLLFLLGLPGLFVALLLRTWPEAVE